MKTSNKTHKFRVLACVVSYRNPTVLKCSLNAIAGMEFPDDASLEVCVIDNSEDSSIISKIRDVCRTYKARLIVSELNGGVAGAYSTAMGLILEEGFDYLWLWDQDSSAPPGCLRILLESFRREDEKQSTGYRFHPIQSPLGIVGPKLIDRNGVDEFFVFYNDPYDLSRMYERCFPLAWIEGGEVQTTYLVGSGSLIRREVIEKVKGPDVSFFMDTVDFEYCSKVISAGYRIIVNADTWFNHRVGHPSPRKVGTKKLYGRNYLPFRYYYQARNDILLTSSKSTLIVLFRMIWVVFVRGVRIFLTEKKVFKKITAHYFGLFHGLIGKRGRKHSAWMLKH